MTWIGKEIRPKLEPRILLEDSEKSYHAKHRVTDHDHFDNKLIFGDNLLALKALEVEFIEKIKCIYIDPPFNTGAAFEHYDDGVEHSTWLCLMAERFRLIHRLISEDGALFVHLDDNEADYCKVVLDEIFGRENFISRITIDARSPSAFSTVNPGVFKASEYLLWYAKNRSSFRENGGRVPREPDYAYNKWLPNPNDTPDKWRLIPIMESYEKVPKPRSKHPRSLLEHFNEFVIANANKVFRPNSPKYVFQGIAEFATNAPEIITGDDYESGRGVRKEDLFGPIHVNIFNISKINSEVRGGKAPRIKRLSEYIGQSYFNYLAGLSDLVLLMDESHRYRASAGVQAINELKPIIGLELTATPQVETNNRPIPFKNIIYSYPLASALADGFVKEPAVATRENFNASNYTEEQLEQLKLEDAVRIHENTKVELEVYARQNDRPLVKPFMLVVAQNTEHANKLVADIKKDSFFEGRYKDRVITVHSNQRGEEADETVERLLAVENPNEPTEIVVHVNMLKEGWDVTNLYTIVPLRAANSKTLVEQSIGRGLRLPYGKRVGVSAVDRLTIVAHDKFQEIIDQANSPDSIIRTGIIIGRDIPVEKKEVVIVQPKIIEQISKPPAAGDKQQTMTFPTPVEQEVARITCEVVKDFEQLPNSKGLQAPEIQKQIVERVANIYTPKQGEMEGVVEKPNIPEIVAKATQMIVTQSIDIPCITVLPKGEVTSGFKDFDLDLTSVHLQPVAMEILIQHLRTNAREKLMSGDGISQEERPEDYLVRGLVDYDDISYDDHADLLYKLSAQVVAYLRSYLPSEDAVLNVLQYHQRKLSELVHLKMQEHHWEKAAGYEPFVSKGFRTLRPNNYSALTADGVRNFRAPVEERQMIRGMLFGGFARCLYSKQKFHSDPERRFAVLLEDETDELKWFKPGPGDFPIPFRNDEQYEPDFVVETKTEKIICEPKRADEMTDKTVQDKARAAVVWCQHATNHEKQNGGKPWRYLLIPHDAITANASLAGLAAQFTV